MTPVSTCDLPAPPPTRDQRSNPLPPRPDSLILGAPINQKEAQRREEEQDEVGEEATESADTERTVEGSSGSESRKPSYGELEGTYRSELAKEEPAAVSLEFGVARMSCWNQTKGIVSERRVTWFNKGTYWKCVVVKSVILFMFVCQLRKGPRMSELLMFVCIV